MGMPYLRKDCLDASADEIWGPKTLAWARSVVVHAQERNEVLLRFDDDGGFLIMSETPPVEIVPSQPVPRVCFIGGVDKDVYLHEILEQLQVDGVEISGTRQMGMWFWRQFFGCDDFLDHPEHISLPTLIVTDGRMRAYTSSGEGNWHDCLEKIEWYTKKWNVPIRVVPS